MVRSRTSSSNMMPVGSFRLSCAGVGPPNGMRLPQSSRGRSRSFQRVSIPRYVPPCAQQTIALILTGTVFSDKVDPILPLPPYLDFYGTARSRLTPPASPGSVQRHRRRFRTPRKRVRALSFGQRLLWKGGRAIFLDHYRERGGQGESEEGPERCSGRRFARTTNKDPQRYERKHYDDVRSWLHPVHARFLICLRLNNPEKGAVTHAVVHRALGEYLSSLVELENESEREKLWKEIFEAYDLEHLS